jgi:zinc protease
VSSLRSIAAAALVAFAACGGELEPPKVPPPTTAHPVPLPPEAVPSLARRTADARVVAFRVLFSAGSADDPAGKEGLTELTARMIADSGTKELPYAEVLRRLYPFAAQIQVGVDRDQTVLAVEVAAEKVGEFYPLLRDVLLGPRMDEEAFGRLSAAQKSSLVDELRGANDEALGKEALQALMYAGHPYGHPTHGTESGLATITLDDVKAHRVRVFCKDRVVLGIAGGYPEGFDRRVAEDLAQLPACKGPGSGGEARPALPEPKSADGLKVLIVDKPSADATAVSMGLPLSITRSSEEWPALFFFTSYVGLHRQSSGVLYNRLREARGLNYGDYAYAEHFEQDGWSRFQRANTARRQQYASIWLRPVKPENGPFALRAALHYFRRQIELGITEDEIARYRTFLGRYIGLEQQTETRRLGLAQDDRSYGLSPGHVDRLRAAFAQLDPARIRGVVDRHLAGKGLYVAIVAKDGAALKQLLVSGKATPPSYASPKPKEVTDEDETIQKLPLGLRDEDVKVVKVDDLFR